MSNAPLPIQPSPPDDRSDREFPYRRALAAIEAVHGAQIAAVSFVMLAHAAGDQSPPPAVMTGDATGTDEERAVLSLGES